MSTKRSSTGGADQRNDPVTPTGTSPDNDEAAVAAATAAATRTKGDSNGDGDTSIEALTAQAQALHIDDDKNNNAAPVALRQLASWIQNGQVQNIMAVSGAGVSVAAGLPDFRTPGTGLYDNLQAYHLPYPEAVFDVAFYRRKPAPFVRLARELWPGNCVPTLTHCFLALLAHKGLLLRNYSQNIDGLEYLAKQPADTLVECHGHFRSASCIKCGTAADIDVVYTHIRNDTVPICHECQSYVKPDIVFFGEGLPDRFHDLLPRDRQRADCCLVLGTSLQVAPVSLIPSMVRPDCKRVLINRDLVGNDMFEFDSDLDWFAPGDCDASIQTLVELLGWQDELQAWYNDVKVSIACNKDTSGAEAAPAAAAAAKVDTKDED